jgi:NAD(P)-dependent dehydrogenase (short-subunit alcohol dehydrogenase family)
MSSIGRSREATIVAGSGAEPSRDRSDAPTGVRLRTLHGKAVIITGAGSGIGRAAAMEAAARGARTVLVGRRVDHLATTAEASRHAGGEAVVAAIDVVAPEAPNHIVHAALDAYGRVDGLVNSAGVARFGFLDTATDAEVRAMFEVNFMAPLRLIRACISALRETRGSIVNVSSIGGIVPTPGRAAYGAIKAAVNHLTRSLARELAPDVRINAILPGAIATPMWGDLGISNAETDALFEEMIQTTPMRRMGKPEEIAPWVCDLLENERSWVTGSLITVDGGRSS